MTQTKNELRKQKTFEKFLVRAKECHKNKYDYSLARYKGGHIKIAIVCPEHGVFYQNPLNHVSKHNQNGCPQCNGGVTITLKDFLRKCEQIHGDYYDYSEVDYISSKRNVKIECPIHGFFKQTPSNHTHKTKPQGCPKCGMIKNHNNLRLGVDEFIKRAREKYGDKFDYSLVEYRNIDTNVKIICPEHGVFEQIPWNHLNKTTVYGCMSCFRDSKVSFAGAAWLDSLGIDGMIREKEIKIGSDTFFVDGYDPGSNTIYEFFGAYWHGDINRFQEDEINAVVGKTFGELHQKTLDRVELFRYHGYNVVFKWES